MDFSVKGVSSNSEIGKKIKVKVKQQPDQKTIERSNDATIPVNSEVLKAYSGIKTPQKEVTISPNLFNSILNIQDYGDDDITPISLIRVLTNDYSDEKAKEYINLFCAVSDAIESNSEDLESFYNSDFNAENIDKIDKMDPNLKEKVKDITNKIYYVSANLNNRTVKFDNLNEKFEYVKEGNIKFFNRFYEVAHYTVLSDGKPNLALGKLYNKVGIYFYGQHTLMDYYSPALFEKFCLDKDGNLKQEQYEFFAKNMIGVTYDAGVKAMNYIENPETGEIDKDKAEKFINLFEYNLERFHGKGPYATGETRAYYMTLEALT